MSGKTVTLHAALLLSLSIAIISAGVDGFSARLSNTLVYVSVEPARSGQVTFTPEDGIVDQWPLGGLATETFHLAAFPQGKYLYVSVKPYGCHEVLNIDVSPESLVVRRGADRAVIHLAADYVNVRAVLYEVPPDRCEYHSVGPLRIRKIDAFVGVAMALGSAVSALVAYGLKARRGLKMERRDRLRRELGQSIQRLMMRFRNAGATPLDPLCHLVSYLLDPTFDLDRYDKETLYRALADDETLDKYSETLKMDLGRLDPLTAFINHSTAWHPLALGLKTYLSALDLMPSTSKVLEDILLERPDHEIKIDRGKIFDTLIGLVKERHDKHMEGLRKVVELLTERESYKQRFYNPHPYYSTILRQIEEEAGYKISLNLRPVARVEAAEEAAGPPGEGVRETRRPETGEGGPHLVDAPLQGEVGEMIDRLGERGARMYGEAGPKRGEGAVEEGGEKTPVQLPKHLRRQIEGLRIPVHEVVASARRYLEAKAAGDEGRTLFREASRLVDKYLADMDENSRISVLTMLASIIIPQTALEVAGLKEEGPVEGGGAGAEGPTEPPHAEREGRPDAGANVVDYRRRLEIGWGQIYLIPHFKALPTFVALDMVDTARCHPIPVEKRLDKMVEEVERAIALGKTPVIVLSKRGYLYRHHRRDREYYAKKFEKVVAELRARRLLHRVGILMPERIYERHGGFGLGEGWSIFRLNLKVPDRVRDVADSLKRNSWIDGKIVDALLVSALLSAKVREAIATPARLDEAIARSREAGDDEAEAVYSAIKRTIQLRRQLIEADIPPEHRKHLVVLKMLRLVRLVKEVRRAG